MESTHLRWDVFVAPGIPVATNDIPPGETHAMWSPTSSTLIYGQRDAVLVDPLLTIKEAETIADWVEASGKNLTTIYATHGHGDHFFGAGTVLRRFPRARFVAMPSVVTVMRQQASPQMLTTFWSARFPGQLSEHPLIAEALTHDSIDLEGRTLVAVEVGHTDTDSTTFLHAPDIGLVVAGDVAYNGVHLYLAESDRQKRQEWIAALDTIEKVGPRAVIAGHKRPSNDDGPHIIEETRQYIRDFDRVADATTTAADLYRQMLALHPDRVNPGALWLSARGVKG